MAPSISSAENSFSSVEKTIYLLLKYYPVENKLKQTAGLIMLKSFIDIKDEDILLMIPELYTFVASCFAIKVITKNVALFYFCIYFGILVLLNEQVLPLSYHVQASFINKKDKYLYR